MRLCAEAVFARRLWLVQGINWCYAALREEETGPARCGYHLPHSTSSSSCWPRYTQGFGLLSANRTDNPDFWAFNKVLVRHCDGGPSNGEGGGRSHIVQAVRRELVNADEVRVRMLDKPRPRSHSLSSECM